MSLIIFLFDSIDTSFLISGIFLNLVRVCPLTFFRFGSHRLLEKESKCPSFPKTDSMISTLVGFFHSHFLFLTISLNQIFKGPYRSITLTAPQKPSPPLVLTLLQLSIHPLNLETYLSFKSHTRTLIAFLTLVFNLLFFLIRLYLFLSVASIAAGSGVRTACGHGIAYHADVTGYVEGWN